jgi:CheY-like chemotaxis protein/anti-sigma regulatory factor (Ser/Thr protein kinase)
VLPPPPLEIEADATRLVQILCNVINNAARYTDCGGRISVTVEQENASVCIRVADNGRGIEPELLPRVFEVFTQAEQAADRAHGGLGVGLALVRSLVEQHDGTIEVQSEGLGKGTQVLVRLPLAGEAQPPTMQAPKPPLPRHIPHSVHTDARMGALRTGAPLRVLIVDDNRDAADSLCELLEMWDCDASVVYSGPEALEAGRLLNPDAVIMDIGMPGMDGYEVARCFREEQGFRGALIALTGYGQPDDRRKAQEAGFDRHLTKPVDPSHLRRLLDEIRAGTPA